MKWSELAGDTWTIPKTRYKTGYKKNSSDVILPLSKHALSILDKCHKIEGPGYVFTSTGRHGLGAFDRVKDEINQRIAAELGRPVPNWRFHDLRRTARSLMARAGVRPDHAERCLGHVLQGVEGIYDRHTYEDEKRQGFEALAALVRRIVDPPPATVVSLPQELQFSLDDSNKTQ
jgi:integrase